MRDCACEGGRKSQFTWLGEIGGSSWYSVRAELPNTWAKSLSSALTHNSANVAVSSKQSPERLHQRMNAICYLNIDAIY